MAVATNPSGQSALAGCTCTDAWLGQCLQKIVGKMGDAIGSGLRHARQDWASIRAAYRIFSNVRVSESEILASRIGVTRGRTTTAAGTLLLLQDTTEITHQHEASMRSASPTGSTAGRTKRGACEPT